MPPTAPISRLKAAKLAVLGQSERTGIFRQVRDSAWRTRRLLILGYHGVALHDEHEWSPDLYLPVQALAARLELLRNHGYAVLPLAEAVDRLYASTLPPRAVALTFDDGTADFYLAAFPLLRQHGFPATVYLTSYYAERGTPVFDVACRYLLWRGRHLTISGEGLTRAGAPLPLGTLDDRDRATDAVRDFAQSTTASVGGERELLRIIAERVGVDFDAFLRERRLQLMSAAEVRAITAAGIDVQLHTHRHRVPLDRALFLRELEDNRRFLREVAGGSTPLQHFCYPSGTTHPDFLPWLREAGVRSATTCDVGFAHQGSDPLLLPRLIDTHNLTLLEFEGWLTGVSSFLPRRRYRPRYRPVPTRTA